MSNKKPIVLLNLRSDGKNGVVDTVTSNQWINDYGTKTKINKTESPFNNPNGCIEFAGGQDRLKLVKYNPNFDMSNTDWTVSLWAKYSSLPPYTNSRGFGHILTHSDMWHGINNGSLWFSLYLGDDFSEGIVPGIAVQIYTSYGHYEKFYTAKCDLREWTHIAWCYVHKTKKLFTFINGKKY